MQAPRSIIALPVSAVTHMWRGEISPREDFSAVYSLLISHNLNEEKIPMNLLTNSTRFLLANVKCRLRHNTKDWRQNDSRMKARRVYFRAPYSTRHSGQLNSNRKDTTVSLIRPGQDTEVHNRFAREKSLEPLAASSEWQSHVPKFGTDGAASSYEIHLLVTPRQHVYRLHRLNLLLVNSLDETILAATHVVSFSLSVSLQFY
jgi:hypothetical protein